LLQGLLMWVVDARVVDSGVVDLGGGQHGIVNARVVNVGASMWQLLHGGMGRVRVS